MLKRKKYHTIHVQLIFLLYVLPAEKIIDPSISDRLEECRYQHIELRNDVKELLKHVDNEIAVMRNGKSSHLNKHKIF